MLDLIWSGIVIGTVVFLLVLVWGWITGGSGAAVA